MLNCNTVDYILVVLAVFEMGVAHKLIVTLFARQILFIENVGVILPKDRD